MPYLLATLCSFFREVFTFHVCIEIAFLTTKLIKLEENHLSMKIIKNTR